MRVRPAASPATWKSETPSSVLGGDEDQVGGVAVEHEHLRAVELVAVARAGGLHGDAGLVPLAALLGEGERWRSVSPEAMPGRSSFLAASSPACSSRLVARATVEKYGARQQAAAHLLEHDGELDVAEALAAELLGDDQALEPELVRHLGPHRGVVALGGLHEAADLGLGRLGVEELADDAPQLLLLLGEGEVHGADPAAGGGAPATRSVYTCVRMNVRTLRGRAGPGPAAGRGRRADRRDRRRPAGGPARPGRGRAHDRSRRSTTSSPAACSSAPAATTAPPPSLTVPLWAGARLDRLLREIRG